MKKTGLFCVLALVVIFIGTVSAEEVKRAAKIISYSGNVSVKLVGADEWQPAVKDLVLNEGDRIKTMPESTALLNLNGSGETATVELSPGSELSMIELVKNVEDGTQKTLLDLALGEIMISVQKLTTPESKFEVKTPTSVVGVRGTKFKVKVESIE